MLAKVGAPFDEKLRGSALASVVLVKASDGYPVAFGLTEAGPGTRPNRIVLADRADGTALSAKDGPFKLVVEGDLRSARGVRMVTAISVVALTDAKGAPSHKH